MFFLTVIPIRKGLPLEELTYISKYDFAIGDIVVCPFRSSSILGLLIEKKSILDAKSDIRKSAYEIKKIETKESYSFLSEADIEVFKKTSDEYIIPFSDILSFFIPPFLFEDKTLLEKRKETKNNTSSFQSFYIEESSDRHYAHYLSLIEKTKGSVVIVHPTAEGVDSLAKKFKGVKKVIHLSGSSSAVTKIRRSQVLREEESLLFITTPSYILLSPQDAEVVICDEWSSPYYYTALAPFFDTRYFIENYFKTKRIFFYKSDIYIGENTEKPLQEKEDVTSDILDMSLKPLRFNDFLSTTLYSALTSLHASQGRAFLYASFLKNYSVTICDDCGKILKDSCGGALIQEEEEGKLFYSCTSCQKKIDLIEGQEVLCPGCGSFRLSLLNPGISTIKKELETMGFRCFDITSLETKTSLKKTCGEFYNTPGAVLIGTSKALPYIKDKVSLSAILSLDTLFYTEDHLLDDKIMWLLSHIYDHTKNYFFIQTKFPTKKVFTSFIKKDPLTKKNLLAEKKEFSIPPYGKIIIIEKRGALSLSEKKFFQDILGENMSLNFFNNKTFLTTLYQMQDFKKNKSLFMRLYNLPKEFTVKVF